MGKRPLLILISVVSLFFMNIFPLMAEETGNQEPFSGTMREYVDEYNGYRLKIPVEFTLDTRGTTTDWRYENPDLKKELRRLYDEDFGDSWLDDAPSTRSKRAREIIESKRGGGIHVTVVEMKNVPPQQLYDIEFGSKKESSDYRDVTPIKMKIGEEDVPAFRCKESEKNPGSPLSKMSTDFERWFLYAYGNGRAYILQLSGIHGDFQIHKYDKIYEDVIQSFQLVPVKR